MKLPNPTWLKFRTVITILILAGVYYTAARLGLLLAFEKTNASPVWPPSGIAFATILILGYRFWPAITIGAFLANIMTFTSNAVAGPGVIFLLSLSIALGNTLEALFGTFLIRRLVGNRNPIERARDVFQFVFVAFVMCLVASTIGTLNLLLLGIIPYSLLKTVWLTWWLGDVGGILVLTPLVIFWRYFFSYIEWKPTRIIEGVIFVILVSVISAIVFGKFFEIGILSYPLTFILIPFVMWGAFRFGQIGSGVSVLIILGMAIWGTLNNTGPFVRGTQNESLLLIQTFIATFVLTQLFLTAVLIEQKKVEQMLRGNEEKTHLILETANDAFIGMNENGIVMDWNRQACAIFGWSREEAIGQPLANLIIPERFREAHWHGLKRFLSTRESKMLNKRIELNALHKDGHELIMELTIWPIRFEGSYHFNAVLRDITEKKQADEKRMQLVRELASTNQELNDFAHVTSHDLKAPLRGIGIMVEWLINDHAAKLDEKGKELLVSLTEKVTLMNALIDGILDYSKVGRLKEKIRLVNVNEILKEVIDLIPPPNHIHIKVQEHLPIIQCEPVRIRQVFQNLIGNAIKYIDKPKGEVEVKCVVEDHFWKFSVSDNGPGINERYFGKIFQMFQTLQPKDRSQSTGIGLAFAKKVVEMYGGRIWLESKLGEGTTFYFTFPRDIKTSP